MQKFVMYKNDKVHRTLNENFMTSFLRNAKKAEFKELKNIIEVMYRDKKAPLVVLDIGVGVAHVLTPLSKERIWANVGKYVGFDNSRSLIRKSREVIRKAKIDKVKIVYFDAINLGKISPNEIFRNRYDLILCTYFTPGNFKPDAVTLKTTDKGLIVPYPQSCLNPNKQFVRIFKAAYRLLNPGGKLILGSTYIDTDVNRKRQEDFYKKCGMTVITSKNDTFTATREGFWSQRFTKARIYSYFSWVDKRKIEFISLDNRKFAQMVVVSK